MSVAKSMHLLFSCGQIKHRLCTKNIEHSLAFFLYLISQIRSNQYYIQHEYDMIILYDKAPVFIIFPIIPMTQHAVFWKYLLH